MTDDMMMSPRKQMASGSKPSGAMGVDKFPMGGPVHIDPSVGAGPHLSDEGRGLGVTPHMGRQKAPDHGPMKDHFRR